MSRETRGSALVSEISSAFDLTNPHSVALRSKSGSLRFRKVNLFHSKKNPKKSRKGAKLQEDEDFLPTPAA